MGFYLGQSNIDGKIHGKGIMIYNDKTIYEGYWYKNTYDGEGFLKRPDGSTYRGKFLCDMPHG